MRGSCLSFFTFEGLALWLTFIYFAYLFICIFEGYISLQKNQLDYMENYSALPDPYKGEVLIINSKDARSTIKALRKRLYKRYPDASKYTFKTEGHILSWSRPQEYKKVIKSFFK